MDRTKVIVKFPWVLCILNVVVCFLACFVSREVVCSALHRDCEVVSMEAAMSGYKTGFICIIALGYQKILFRKLKGSIKHIIIWLILFLLPGVVLGGIDFVRSTTNITAKLILSHANLAPLPQSACDIRAFKWVMARSGEEYLRFTASRSDIESFLSGSPILKDKECQRYGPEKMRLNVPQVYGAKVEIEYFSSSSISPCWFNREIKELGRRYEIRPKGYHYHSEVIFKDQSNTVYIYLKHAG
jgi:hypothetical protein